MGLCDAGAAGIRSDAETVFGFFEKSNKRPAVYRACLCDRNPAGEEVWRTLGIEYVHRVFNDRTGYFGGIYRIYRAGGGRIM